MEEMMATIKMFAGTYAPANFMFCDGSLLQIMQYQALFSLIGTTYGGDGVRTFALPNLNGRLPVGTGNSTTGKSVQLGEAAGNYQNTLTEANLPSFSGAIKVAKTNANSTTPSASSSIAITGTPNGRDFNPIPSYVDGNPDTLISGQSVFHQGQSAPVNNMPPYLGMNYIICVNGIYPPRP